MTEPMLMAVRCENCHHNHDVSKAMAWHISEAFDRFEDAIEDGIHKDRDDPGPLSSFSKADLDTAMKVLDAFRSTWTP